MPVVRPRGAAPGAGNLQGESGPTEKESRLVKISFLRIELKRRRTGVCATCEKKTTQTLAIGQTVNPFNKDARGQPKTEATIRKELAAELRVMLEQPLYCQEHRP